MTIRHWPALALALTLLMTLTLGSRPPVARAVPPSATEAIISWNVVAQRAAIKVAGQAQTQSMISIGFAQAAVYDAVVAIMGGYQPYVTSIAPRPGASAPAAVAAAAYDVLLHYFPAQAAALEADYTAALAAIPEGAAKDEGVAVGRAAAAGLIAKRAGDGLNADIGFTMPAPAPGVWQLPAGVSPQTPWVSQLRPFTFDRPNQFRPAPPPDLAGDDWAEQYAEVQAMGRSDSSSRTAAQTEIARFWSTNAVAQYNLAFKELAEGRGMDTVETARLFAMGNLVGADALIACFDAKYHYLFWRPQFAIPQGESDGNATTAGDTGWKPLLATPNHPEYPAAHGCLTAAEAEVFAAALGTNRIEIDLTSSVTGLAQPTRHYARAIELTQEIVDARVWGGVHYRGSVEAGLVVGRKVAHWPLKRFFLPHK
jgi:hypothetical protein